MAMAIAYVWIKEGLYDKEYVDDPHRRLRQVEGLSRSARRTASPKTPEWQEKETGVPAKDVRALAREWGSKRVYLAPGGWGNGHGGACRNQTGIQWARVMVCLIGDAGPRQARRQHGQSAMGQPARLQFLFPRLRRRRHVGRPRKHLDAGRALPAHAAAADHEHARSSASRASGCRRRSSTARPRAIRWIGKSIEHQFAKFSYPAPGHAPVQDALQVRRLDPRHHEQHQPPRADVPVGESRIRRQPVDLVRGRGEVRRRHPAGLHQFRARRHQRMGRARRLRPSRPAAAQPPRHHLPGAGDRAARRVEVRLLDLQRDLQAARPRQLLLRGHQRDRLGQAACSTPPTCPR